MNWLAHVALAQPDHEWRLGNLLADFLKGRTWPEMSDGLAGGLRLHQQIDAFTDAHPSWRNSCARLGDKGFLRGVVVDVVYDHLLTCNWDNFTSQSLRGLLDEFYVEALTLRRDLPEDAAYFVERLVHSDRLGRYGTLELVDGALARIDGRLSERIRQRETTRQYASQIAEAYDGLEADFLAFYPELMAHVEMRLKSHIGA